MKTLELWRKENCYTQSAFARLLGEKAGLAIDRTAVWHWEHGTRPRKAALQAIRKVTRGQVTADSFGAPPTAR